MINILIKLKKFFTIDFYKYNFSRIFTIAEKNVKIQLRFKLNNSDVYNLNFPFNNTLIRGFKKLSLQPNLCLKYSIED